MAGKRLRDVTDMVRSRNAGAFLLTFDIMFRSDDEYVAVRDAGVLGPELFARLYQVPVEAVKVTPYDTVRAIKVTVPRRTSGGSPDDTDVDGAQQYVPLLDIELPE